MPEKIKYMLPIFALIYLNSFGQDVFEAARKGNISRMETLLKLNPDTLSSHNENGFTPLIIAVYRNQAKVTEYLLLHKVNVNTSSPEGPALLGASYKGNIELAELLLQYGADVNICNETGTSALMYAALSNNLALAKLLLKNGAKKNLVEKSGKTALDYAKIRESPEMISLLSE